METFSTRLERLLKEKNITQTAIAEKLSIQPTTISNWKRKGTYPSADDAVKIAKMLNTTVEYLITGEEDSVPQNVLNLAYEILALPPMLRNVVFATLQSCKDQLSALEAEKISDVG